MSAQTLDTAVPRTAGHASVVGGKPTHRTEVPHRELGGWGYRRDVRGLIVGFRRQFLYECLECLPKSLFEMISIGSRLLAFFLGTIRKSRQLGPGSQVGEGRVRVVMEIVLLESLQLPLLSPPPRGFVQDAGTLGVGGAGPTCFFLLTHSGLTIGLDWARLARGSGTRLG